MLCLYLYRVAGVKIIFVISSMYFAIKNDGLKFCLSLCFRPLCAASCVPHVQASPSHLQVSSLSLRTHRTKSLSSPHHGHAAPIVAMVKSVLMLTAITLAKIIGGVQYNFALLCLSSLPEKGEHVLFELHTLQLRKCSYSVTSSTLASRPLK